MKKIALMFGGVLSVLLLWVFLVEDGWSGGAATAAGPAELGRRDSAPLLQVQSAADGVGNREELVGGTNPFVPN